MAFMMPVMKNNFDIYKDGRSRKTSEGAEPVSAAVRGAGSAAGRVRKVSECKSESYATSPTHAYRMNMQRCQSTRAFPRNASRTSHTSGSGALSPTRSFCQPGSSPPKVNAKVSAQTQSSGSQNDISKFHLLVDKLRNPFRKDSAKRS